MYIKILQSNEIFSSFGKPYYVYVSLNNTCNANCRFCDTHKEKQKNGIIDVDCLIDDLADEGTQYIHFLGGGEPFTDPQIWDYFRHISQRGLKFAVTTNGLHPRIPEIASYPCSHILLSLDSHEPEMHNYYRGVDRIWETAVAHIQEVYQRNPNIKIVINHLLHNQNVEHFSDMLKLKQEVPFQFINPIFVKDMPEMQIDNHQFSDFLNSFVQYEELAKELGITILYDEQVLQEQYAEGGIYAPGHIRRCYLANYAAFIDCPTARVYPCDCTIHRSKEHYGCGNLLEQSFKEIWNGGKFAALRNCLENEGMDCSINCDLSHRTFNLAHKALNKNIKWSER